MNPPYLRLRAAAKRRLPSKHACGRSLFWKKRLRRSRWKKKTKSLGDPDAKHPLPQRDAALNGPAQKPSNPYRSTGGVPISPRTLCPVLNSDIIGQTPAWDQLLSPRFPVVPKAWPPQTKRRWRLGRRSRCPKFFARYRSQNFDRCHSFLLASSAAGGARKRPRFAKRSPGIRGGYPLWGCPPRRFPPLPRPRRRNRSAMRRLAGVVDGAFRNPP